MQSPCLVACRTLRTPRARSRWRAASRLHTATVPRRGDRRTPCRRGAGRPARRAGGRRSPVLLHAPCFVRRPGCSSAVVSGGSRRRLVAGAGSPAGARLRPPWARSGVALRGCRCRAAGRVAVSGGVGAGGLAAAPRRGLAPQAAELRVQLRGGRAYGRAGGARRRPRAARGGKAPVPGPRDFREVTQPVRYHVKAHGVSGPASRRLSSHW